MTIFERLEAAEAELAALKAAAANPPAPVTDAALEARVAVLEGEVGTPAVAPSA